MIGNSPLKPMYTIALSSERRGELASIYRSASQALEIEALQAWLVRQPSLRVVGQAKSAMGCLIATYLISATEQMWCVGQDRFWRFDLTPELAWSLPRWAIVAEQLELRMATSLTASDGLRLVHFIRHHNSISPMQIDAWLSAGNGMS